MALSGSFNTSAWTSSSGDKISLLFSWAATQDANANTSTISWTLKGARSNSGYVNAGGFKVVIDGETVYSKSTSYRISLYNGTVVASGTKPITHNNDGSRSFSVSVEAGIYYYDVNCTGSKTFSLDTIPRVSTISATDANIGSNTTISISRASSSFTNTLAYTFGSLSGTIVEKTTQASVSWTVPTAFYAIIPNSPSGECVITWTTYNGTAVVGTTQCVFDAIADKATCAPKVSVSSVDVNPESTALTGNNKALVSGVSNLRVITTATAKNSATISSISVYCGSAKKYGENVMFSGVDSTAVYVIVTDSRGHSTRVDDDSLSLINYIAPTIIPTISRDTPTGNTVTVSVMGKWYNGSFGSSANTLKITVRRKAGSDSDYHTFVDIPLTTNGNDYTATVKLTDIDYTKAYSFLLRLDDAIYTDAKGYRDAKYAIVPLSKGLPIFDWGENDFQFNVPVNLPGGPLADYVIEEGNNGDWYYRKWAQGITEAWYRKSLSTLPFTDKIADGLYSNDTHRGVTVSIPEGLFYYAPYFTGINAFANAVIQSQIGSASTTWLTYRLWSSYSTTPSNLEVLIYVIGRWKL